MASHHVTVAKASLVAACLRPDVTKISRDDVNEFHSLLENSLLHCTPSNVQSCKRWLVDNIAPSQHRTTALGKYLVSICKYAAPVASSPNGKKISSNRQRLHILYVINDLLHHVAYHVKETHSHTNLQKGLGSVISDLVLTITSTSKTRMKAKITDLLRIWEANKYFSADLLQTIAKAIAAGKAATASEGLTGPSERPRELPYIMPTSHGDPSTPFYDLPAANLMPHIIPNNPTPIRPDQVRALQLSAGPADEGLARAVKEFLKGINKLDKSYDGLDEDSILEDIDELGQSCYRNEDDEVAGDTYYGWSRSFCEKMKSRGRPTSNGSERSRSPNSICKRRRRDSPRSWSRSRSSSRDRGRSRSYSPETDRPRFGAVVSSAATTHHDDPSRQTATSTLAQAGFPPPPLGPNSMPIPPPRPMNWKGPWPPPLPISLGSAFPNMQFPPPPPPPAASSHRPPF